MADRFAYICINAWLLKKRGICSNLSRNGAIVRGCCGVSHLCHYLRYNLFLRFIEEIKLFKGLAYLYEICLNRDAVGGGEGMLSSSILSIIYKTINNQYYKSRDCLTIML